MTARDHNNLYNEDRDGFVPTDPRETALDAELQAIRDAWTLEATKTRRAAWNAYLADAKRDGHKVKIHEVEKAVGFALADLKRAVVRHKL